MQSIAYARQLLQCSVEVWLKVQHVQRRFARFNLTCFCSGVPRTDHSIQTHEKMASDKKSKVSFAQVASHSCLASALLEAWAEQQMPTTLVQHLASEAYRWATIESMTIMGAYSKRMSMRERDQQSERERERSRQSWGAHPYRAEERHRHTETGQRDRGKRHRVSRN